MPKPANGQLGGLKLQRRKTYGFHHTRKGAFRGIYEGRVKAPKDDPEDTEFLTVAMDTSDGSGAEWLRRAAGAQVTTTDLRPSLITKITEVKNG